MGTQGGLSEAEARVAELEAALAAAATERDQAQQITESWYRQYQVTSAALAAAEQRATRLEALEQAARAFVDTYEAKESGLVSWHIACEETYQALRAALAASPGDVA